MTDTSEPLPFEEERDARLGEALRAALDGPAPEAFLARLRLAIGQRRETSWDILARWAPVGVAAAAAAAAVLWLLLRPVADPGHPAMLASAPVRMEAAPSRPESEVLTTSLLEDR